jgi:transcriptional regulator with XRE-family HTH domain
MLDQCVGQQTTQRGDQHDLSQAEFDLGTLTIDEGAPSAGAVACLGTKPPIRVVKYRKYVCSEPVRGVRAIATTLGDRIQGQRKKKGYTLEELAARSESSKSYIWELENKDPPRPSGEKLALIAKALDVTPDYLLGVEIEVESAEDKAFFRKYQKMTATQKSQIREMLEIINRKK